jgi:hypothetical protein
MRIMRTVAAAGVTVVAVSGLVGTILPAGNTTPTEVQAHQQQVWAEQERQRVENENSKLPRSPQESSGSGAADSAGDVGGADADDGVTAAADQSGADDAADGLVEAFLRH